jgi:hypothetical protein
MATNAQIAANRRNAEKSTGPQTEAGKAAVAQNALKHGLAAAVDVVSWEDPAQFELYRRQMLAELAPAGIIETMLAERVVSLSWRLRRAQFMQHEVIESQVARPASTGPSLADRLDALRGKRPLPPKEDPQTEAALWIGRSLTRDWAGERVLERMLMYERRIESSLYRTLAELQRLRLMRKLEADVGAGDRDIKISPSVPASGGPDSGDKRSCETAPLEATSLGTHVEKDMTVAAGSECAEQTQFAEPAPHGAAAGSCCSPSQGQAADAGVSVCKTNPISGWRGYNGGTDAFVGGPDDDEPVGKEKRQ